MRPLALEQETEIQLAPAAGAGIGKLFAERLLANPGFIDLMVDAANSGLLATRTYYVKDEGMHTEPDPKVRLQALSLILAHMEGEPVKRIIHQHLGAGGKLDPLAALQESPELLEGMKDLIQKAEWKKSGRQAHKRPKKVAAITPPAVEIEPE